MRSVSREGVIMGELKDLENIGAKTEEQLNQAGIYTKEQLIKAGSKEAWLKIRAFDGRGGGRNKKEGSVTGSEKRSERFF